MNTLTGACLSRFSRNTFWATPCCKDTRLVGPIERKPVSLPCTIKYPGTPKICTGNLRVGTGLTFWTQVRLKQKPCHPQSQFPQLHRDIPFPDFDAYRKNEFKDVRKTSWGSGDKKPGYAWAIAFLGGMCGAYSVKSELIHFLSSMSAAADVLALASIEVDLSKVAAGQCVAFKWRGKPLFIKNRTPADIDAEANTPLSSLRDPQTGEDRMLKPEWLVVIGVCTHLGCVPIGNTGDFTGGFYCPCHGSHYDNMGRTRKGPAPTNLVVPPYKFVSDSVILVG